jgi:transposase
MARRELTGVRYEEIKRLLAEGRKVREIARALKCSRDTVRDIRDGKAPHPDRPKILVGPLWAEGVCWSEVVTELGLGHPLKLIWEERAQSLTTYSNFWKQFYRKFPQFKAASVTLREFAPGERTEVDYAGDTISWLDLKTGEIHEAPVFVACLGFSQLFFAWASDDMKSRNWLHSHRRMLEAFGGVPHVVVPDCLKQGVHKCHIYDPDLNPAYSEWAEFYHTAIVPARPGHPKDKALVEGAVKILMRYFKWLYRRHTFTSLSEINRALTATVERINRKPHTRFRVSRIERFEKLEKQALKPLPERGFETADWKDAKLHPDCCISIESAYYSAPHVHRGQKLRVKLTENHVEIFFKGERLAIHSRDRSRDGRRIINPEHLPPNSRAYHEATPQNLLSQARFLDPELHAVVDELFEKDTLGNIRRVQGLIRTTVLEINQTSHAVALPRVKAAIAQMRRFQKFRVGYFQECLRHLRKQAALSQAEDRQAREIVRKPGNPMLRYEPKQMDLEAEIARIKEETL